MPQRRPHTSIHAAARRLLFACNADLIAQKGELPPEPDMSAKTHEKYRPVLRTLTILAKAGDLEGLKRQTIEPNSSSRRALAMYRDLCVVALTKQRAAMAQARAGNARQTRTRSGRTEGRKA